MSPQSLNDGNPMQSIRVHKHENRREDSGCRAVAFLISIIRIQAAAAQHLLYVASPGIRNYVEYGGVGILVFDIDNGYKFVRRIPTWDVPVDAVTGKKIWDQTYKDGCDRGLRGERVVREIIRFLSVS